MFLGSVDLDLSIGGRAFLLEIGQRMIANRYVCRGNPPAGPSPQPQPQNYLFGFQGKVPVWTKRMFYAQLAGLLVLGTFREFVLGTGSKGWFGSPEPWEIQV
jgi:hypothetical protein